MKKFIIASLLACFIGGPALLHGDKANRLAIRDELQQLAVQNENFVALQELEAKSQKGLAPSVAKLGAHAPSLWSLVGFFMLMHPKSQNNLKGLDALIEISLKKKFIPPMQYVVPIVFCPTVLALSYILHRSAEHTIAPKDFTNKLKRFFETWDNKSTFYNFKSKLSDMLRPVMEKHYTAWAKLKNESKEKADAYIHDLSCELRACARSFKKTGFWKSLVGKQTIAEGIILAGGLIIYGIYKAKKRNQYE